MSKGDKLLVFVLFELVPLMILGSIIGGILAICGAPRWAAVGGAMIAGLICSTVIHR